MAIRPSPSTRTSPMDHRRPWWSRLRGNSRTWADPMEEPIETCPTIDRGHAKDSNSRGDSRACRESARCKRLLARAPRDILDAASKPGWAVVVFSDPTCSPLRGGKDVAISFDQSSFGCTATPIYQVTAFRRFAARERNTALLVPAFNRGRGGWGPTP